MKMGNTHSCISALIRAQGTTEALYNFSKLTVQAEKKSEQQEPLYQKDKDGKQDEKSEGGLKRSRDEDHEQQLAQDGEDRFAEKKEKKVEEDRKQEGLVYLSFQKGDKILVEQSFDNGWWFGNVIKKPAEKGFFPSNYVKVGAKPPPPSAPKAELKQEDEEAQFDAAEEAAELIGTQLGQLKQVEKGAVTSDYYQGITRYKYVKINDNNKNILNASYVKFDANTGLAKVPVKDQAPCAKAVRQMGYYFDYHQWNQQRNKNPQAHRNRPDPKKKKQKKLHLVGMGKDA